MQNKITINPSEGGVVDIDYVGYGTETSVYFEGDLPWTGVYEFRLFNSTVKNNTVANECALTTVTVLMTLLVKGVEKGTHYYEIWDTGVKQIVLRGSLVLK
jgi:hypothetical protein